MTCTISSKITFTAKVADFAKTNLLKLLIGSQPIIEGKSLICCRTGQHSINLDNAKNSLMQNLLLWR